MIQETYDYFRMLSLKLAVKRQKLGRYLDMCYRYLPEEDLMGQYNSFIPGSEYVKLKIRCLHAFQLKLMDLGLDRGLGEIIDLGDSCGNHLAYAEKILKGNADDIYMTGVNIDSAAISKIEAKGYLGRQEDVTSHLLNRWPNETPCNVLCFETLEHLDDPIRFLKALCRFRASSAIITVPYVRRSRLGLFRGYHKHDRPEDVHIFELCPEEWRMLFDYCGLDIVFEQIYLQYPVGVPFLASYWKRFDFEGFYGIILKPYTL